MSHDPKNTGHERLLSESEGNALYKQMASAWGIGPGYWWPLSQSRPPHAEAFQSHYFEDEFGAVALRRILADLGLKTIFEFRENGRSYEVSVAAFEAYYGGLEGFWTNDRFDWILYASHESSVTVAGEHLLPAVKAAWPTWQQRIWVPFQAPN